MQAIASRKKTYEFRKYRLVASVQRIWFYRTAPHSSIEYVCDMEPARTRDQGDKPLPDDGLGNLEFNARDKEYEGYDFAYRILCVRQMRQPLTLDVLKSTHGMKSAPRGMVYTPQSILDSVDLENEAELLWRVDNTKGEQS